jgi:hypothetical protein
MNLLRNDERPFNESALDFKSKRRQFKWAVFAILTTSGLLLLAVLIHNANHSLKSLPGGPQDDLTNSLPSLSDP